MRKYILVSKKFEGYIVYGYNAMGYLVYFENCSWDMTSEQYDGVLRELRYGLTFPAFKVWADDRGYQLILIRPDLSFTRFWMVFDNARNKKQAEALWSKMKDAEREYIFYVHEAYCYYLKVNDWVTKMYPDTFLRGHIHDEWFKVQPPKK